MTNTNHFQRSMEMMLERSQYVLNKFSAEMLKNPQSAFEWGESAFEAAAQHKVASVVLECLAQGTSYDDIKELATENAMRAARWPEKSTSASSNLAKQTLGAAWANLASDM